MWGAPYNRGPLQEMTFKLSPDGYIKMGGGYSRHMNSLNKRLM